MSTIVMTPDHIACDHAYYPSTFPQTMAVDPGRSKIFISEDDSFLYAAVGDYDPDIAMSSDCENMVRDLIAIIEQKFAEEPGLSIDFLKTDHADIISRYLKYLDDMTFIVAGTNRYVIMYSQKTEQLVVAHASKFVGGGTGGAFAEGLLHGGMDIRSIWKPLNRLCGTSSIERTIVDLSTFKEV